MKTEQQINDLKQLNEELRANGMKKVNVKKQIAGSKTKLAKIEKDLALKKIQAENEIYTGVNAGDYKNETARKKAVEALLETSEAYQSLLTNKDFFIEEINLAEQRLTLYRVDYKYTDNLLNILLSA